jgi:hypothetical protein
MDDLPLEVGEIHCITIGNTKSTYTRCSQVEKRGRAEAAGSNHKDTGVYELLLSLAANFLKEYVTGIPFNLFLCKYEIAHFSILDA